MMDAFCVQTRADLEADPNALEFFNVFFSKENVSKMKDLQQQTREGYEPGGHRMSALRGSLAAAADILAAAFSGSFFSHTGRSNIGAFAVYFLNFQFFFSCICTSVLVCCTSFSAWGLQINQVKILAACVATCRFLKCDH